MFNQDIFNELFKPRGRKERNKNKRINNCVNHILYLLKMNQVVDYIDLKNITELDKDIIDYIIYSETNNTEEYNEIKFLIRLELSDEKELIQFLKELELVEEYEKCIIIKKRLENETN
jgi:hypothetical protein